MSQLTGLVAGDAVGLNSDRRFRIDLSAQEGESCLRRGPRPQVGQRLRCPSHHAYSTGWLRRARVGRGGTVLDIGSGADAVVQHLQALGYDAWGVCPSEEAADSEAPQDEETPRIQYGRLAASLPIQPHTADLVLVRDVALYRPVQADPESLTATANMLAALRPGREMMLIEPAQPGPDHSAHEPLVDAWSDHFSAFPGRLKMETIRIRRPCSDCLAAGRPLNSDSPDSRSPGRPAPAWSGTASPTKPPCGPSSQPAPAPHDSPPDFPPVSPSSIVGGLKSTPSRSARDGSRPNRTRFGDGDAFTGPPAAPPEDRFPPGDRPPVDRTGTRAEEHQATA